MEAWNYSDQQERLCQRPSITELFPALAPGRTQVSITSSAESLTIILLLFKGHYVHPGSISYKKDQKCPLPRKGVTPSRFPCPRRSDWLTASLTWEITFEGHPSWLECEEQSPLKFLNVPHWAVQTLAWHEQQYVARGSVGAVRSGCQETEFGAFFITTWAY